jgi:hypothetical protein
MVHRVDLASGFSVDVSVGLSTTGKLLITRDGDVLVGSGSKDSTGRILKKIDLGNNQVAVFASQGGLLGPFSLEYGPDGMIYSLNVNSWANDAGGTRIYRFDEDGTPLGKWADISHAATADLMFIGDDRLWVASILDSQLTLLNSQTGQVVKSVQGGSWNWDLLHMPEPASLSWITLAASLWCLRSHRRRPLLKAA